MLGGDWDAIVVGGGPAGLAASIALRERGLQVMVAEALTPPIDKACGEGLMPDSRRELALLGIQLGAEDGAEFDGIHFADGEAGAVRDGATALFKSGPGLGVRRTRLHARMVERAVEAGVDLRWGSRVEMREGRPLRVNGEVAQYRYVIGADGQSSRVRSWAGLGNGCLISRRVGFRRHYQVEPWSGNVEVHWGAWGQAYVTPVSTGQVCVATMTRMAGLSHEDVLAGLPYVRSKLAGATGESGVRGSVTTTRSLDEVATESVALIGDASGSADAITGEGLAMGFRQALLLADSVRNGSLDGYRAGHGNILRLPQTMARVMLAMDRSAWFRRRALRMLAADPALFARMLTVHTGEESLGGFLMDRGWQVGRQMLAPSRMVSRNAAM